MPAMRVRTAQIIFATRAGRIGWIFSLALFLLGCSQGSREFVLYTSAFNLQHQQGEYVLDLVAKGERELFRRQQARSQIVKPFDPEFAAYYVDAVDPPVTASIRNSLRTLKAYNDALGALANGEAAASLTQRASDVASNISSAASATALAVGPPAAIAQATNLITASAQFLNVALPIFRQAATWAAQDAFRRQLVEAYPSMRGLLLTLRNGSPSMYFIMERYRSERSTDTVSGLTLASEAALRRDRETLAGWVLLMNKTLDAMDAAFVAAKDGSSRGSLDVLSNTSVELRILAEKVKDSRAR